jgi:transposase
MWWRFSGDAIAMARAFDDDLRRKFLAAHERGEVGLQKLATLFGVSYGCAQKVVRQKRQTGQAERVGYRPGPRSRMSPEIADYLRAQVAHQSDLTLAELQQRLMSEKSVRFSIRRLRTLVRILGLRLKESRSTPPSVIPKPTGNGVKSSSIKSRRSRWNA